MIKQLIGSVLLIPISAYSTPYFDYTSLANQCRTVSHKLAELRLIQTENACITILGKAETSTDLAANYLADKAAHVAKNHLIETNNLLKQAVLIGCENSLEIDVARSELLEINTQILDIVPANSGISLAEPE